MKKIIWAKLVIFLLLSLIPSQIFAETSNETYFIVTAYYSPLPDQETYITWNYISEKILNWEGIRWASWRWVYSGMLAAPKKYNFWTKIQLDWLWIGWVEDRGWAIVQKWQRWFKYDRIDVWVWYWDEWLKRALYWGKRVVKWKIISKNSKETINYKKIPAPDWATSRLTKSPSVFNKSLWRLSNKNDIQILQKFLTKIWLYNWEIDWTYSNTVIDIVYNFQIKNKIIKNDFSYWAWYWWRQTRKVMKEKYTNWYFDKKEVTLKEKIVQKKEDIFNSPLQGIENTKDLQNILKELWLYNWENDWIYSNIIGTIQDYQIANWVIKDETELWAWYFWPKTRESLKNYYNSHISNQEEIMKLEEEIAKIEEESFIIAKEMVWNFNNPRFWEISTEVRELQKLLNQLWYFNYKDTAIFWVKTRNSLISYQIENSIINSEDQRWAGIFWPKTKENMVHSIKNLIVKEKLDESGLNKKLNELTKTGKDTNTEILLEQDIKIIKA